MTRPAAREQLRLLGEQAEAGVLPEADQKPRRKSQNAPCKLPSYRPMMF